MIRPVVNRAAEFFEGLGYFGLVKKGPDHKNAAIRHPDFRVTDITKR